MDKTYKRPLVIRDSVTTADASGGSKAIVVPRSTPSTATDEFLYNINIKRANIDKTQDAKHFYDVNSGTVVVRTNSSAYVLTANDVITISGT